MVELEKAGLRHFSFISVSLQLVFLYAQTLRSDDSYWAFDVVELGRRPQASQGGRSDAGGAWQELPKQAGLLRRGVRRGGARSGAVHRHRRRLHEGRQGARAESDTPSCYLSGLLTFCSLVVIGLRVRPRPLQGARRQVRPGRHQGPSLVPSVGAERGRADRSRYPHRGWGQAHE